MNDDSLFGFDTLTLNAVIVRDYDDNLQSRQDLAMGLGGDFLTLPAVLVPLGGTPPAGDWLRLGEMQLPKQPGNAAAGVAADAPPSARPVEPASEEQRPVTRFRHPRGGAPAPNFGPDPIVSGAAQWQRMNVVEVAAKRGQAPGQGVARRPTVATRAD